MSWSTAIFIDHNLQFNTAYELINAFEVRTGKPVFEEIFSENKTSEVRCSDTYNGWSTFRYDYETLEGNFKEQGLIQFFDKSNGDEFWVSKNSIMVCTKATSIPYGWPGTIEWLNELAKTPCGRLQNHPFSRIRLELFEICKLFGGKKFVLFCSDANQDILESLWQGTSIADVLNKHKSGINIVRYQNIDKFCYNTNSHTPERTLIYSHTFLLDDFEDLKSILQLQQ